jgi:hypothetical protein
MKKNIAGKISFYLIIAMSLCLSIAILLVKIARLTRALSMGFEKFFFSTEIEWANLIVTTTPTTIRTNGFHIYHHFRRRWVPFLSFGARA